MAVDPTKQKPQLVKDYWPKFKRGAVVIIIALQLLILVALAILLNSFGFFKDNPVGVAGALVANAVLGIVASVIVYHVVAKPIKHLLAALIHIAGEPSSTAPPNPNEAHFQRTGFKPVLQTLYQLAADTPDPIEGNPASQASTVSVPVAPNTSVSARSAIESAPTA